MFNEDDDLLQALKRLPFHRNRIMVSGECPTDELLGAYLGESLHEVLRQNIEAHLVRCPECLEVTVVGHRGTRPDGVEAIPANALNRVIDLIPSVPVKSTLFNLVVRLAANSLDLLATSGEIDLLPKGLPIRGTGKFPSSTTIQISKQLAKGLLTVEIERMEDELCQLSVRLVPAEGALADGLRFSLSSSQREQASYLARQGSAIFEGILPGKYELTLTRPGTYLGSVQLEICRQGETP